MLVYRFLGHHPPTPHEVTEARRLIAARRAELGKVEP